MVLFGGLDERRVDVDPHHSVSGRGEVAAHPAGAAAGVENVGAARCHRVDEAGLPGQVVAGPGHLPEAFDVPLRMPGIGGDLLHPDTRLDHGGSIADAAPDSTVGVQSSVPVESLRARSRKWAV